MAYGEKMGRFRGIRVGRFAGNMGVAEASVKSTDVEGGSNRAELVSNFVLELRSYNGYLSPARGIGCILLTKTGRRRRTANTGWNDSSGTEDPPGEGGPEEAVSYIAETVADLAQVARRHKLEVLVRLLDMAEMEAQERIHRRGKRSLS
jgi:hypothetical protein